MAASPEYPDLPWVPPKSWTNANRTSVQLIVIHDTEGSSHALSAENGAAYNARRPDGTSCHYIHDNTSTVQCVRTEDIAHTARSQGNKRGIHHEACARASWTKSQWLGPSYGLPMLERMARQCARDARKWDIPVRKLTAAQVAADVEGFCGHVECTKAFPQDNGTHTDPGPNYPWNEFLDMVRAEMEDPMPITEADAKLIAAAVQNLEVGRSGLNLGAQIQQTLTAVQALIVMARAEAVEVPPSVAEVVEGIEAAFGTGSAEETAAALKAVLGEKAQEVGRLLSGQA